MTMAGPRSRQSSVSSDRTSRVESGGTNGIFKVALLGFGTVGSSVARILSEHASGRLLLTHVYNRGVARKKVDWLPASVCWTENIDDVLESDANIVVEVIGGIEPAGDWIRKALSSGKSVVTANKQLIANYGPDLLKVAERCKQLIAFGASVAGGVPVISGVQEGLSGDELFKIYGILNGTCNYILSSIENSGATFHAALAEAQKLGYAEADPTDDVDGLDARAKLAILCRVGLHCNVPPGSIMNRTISAIEAVDFEYAAQLGCTIRQISRAELQGKHLLAAVQPALVELTSPLARVQGSQNLVMATGKFGGETVFGGHGAGGNPTAVAVVSDIIAIAKAKRGRNGFVHAEETTPTVTPDFTTKHYLRFKVEDRPGIIGKLAEIFAECDINIDSVLQKPGYVKSSLPFVITLEAGKASLVEKALQKIAELDFLVSPCLDLPMLD
jgi:homoserine dehydrogenase